MSLKEKSPKDTYIKLMVLNSPESNEVISIRDNYAVVDITEPVLEKVRGFGGRCILGVSYQNENTGQDWTPLYYQSPLYDKICWEAERIFDACIVNEKQKNAVKELFRTRLSDAFNSESRTLEFATSLLDKK